MRVLINAYTKKYAAVQADILMNRSSTQFGGRLKVESPKVAGYSVEGAAGIRGTLKEPQLIKDIKELF